MSTFLNSTQKGMALAFVGYTCFSFSDLCVKILSARGFPIFQITTIDCAIGAALLLIFSKKLGGIESLKDIKNAKIHLMRTLLNVCINFLVVLGLSIMPISLLYTGVFTVPLLAAVISIPLFGEKIGFNRAASILAGFCGVLIAFEPWEGGFNILNFGISLLAALVIALMFLISRYLKGTSLLAVGFYPIAGSALLTAPLMMMSPSHIALQDLMFFALSGVSMTTGVVTVSLAFREAASAAVAPIMYSQMLWAILFGILIFGDLPSVTMLIGAVIIVVSGIYLVLSEKHQHVDD